MDTPPDTYGCALLQSIQKKHEEGGLVRREGRGEAVASCEIGNIFRLVTINLGI